MWKRKIHEAQKSSGLTQFTGMTNNISFSVFILIEVFISNGLQFQHLQFPLMDFEIEDRNLTSTCLSRFFIVSYRRREKGRAILLELRTARGAQTWRTISWNKIWKQPSWDIETVSGSESSFIEMVTRYGLSQHHPIGKLLWHVEYRNVLKTWKFWATFEPLRVTTPVEGEGVGTRNRTQRSVWLGFAVRFYKSFGPFFKRPEEISWPQPKSVFRINFQSIGGSCMIVQANLMCSLTR